MTWSFLCGVSLTVAASSTFFRIFLAATPVSGAVRNLPYNMQTKTPIATVSYLRRWQRIHRKLTGSLYRPRHLFMARTLALTGMSPAQTAVVTAHLARVEQAFCCDAIAEHVAATLRPALFATALMESKP